MSRNVVVMLVAGVAIACCSLGGCVVARPRPRARVVAVAPARVWVPAHWARGNVWVEGHWRYH